jgi:NADH-quinone oxidoreductase subunit J
VGLGVLALALVELGLFASFSPPQAIFVQVSFLGVLTAVGTVASRNLVHAALFLVGFFFLVACQFVLLEAEFMAVMQVLVYIGAVAILMMFGIMLTRNIQGDETTGGHWSRKLPAAVVALALFGLIVHGINDQRSARPAPDAQGTPWSRITERAPLEDLSAAEASRPAPVAAATPAARAAESRRARTLAVDNMALVLGRELMTRWVVPFEIAGLLLTAALVGAIALAMSDRAGESPRRGSIATTRSGLTPGAVAAGAEPRPVGPPSQPTQATGSHAP